MTTGRYTLYGGGPSRSMLTEMVLIEGDLDYDLVEVDILNDAHKEPAFHAINPFGWVPALVAPDGETIGETPAINLWLCETHGLDLVPGAKDPYRARFLTVFHNVIGEVEPTLKRIFFAHRYALAPDQIAATRRHGIAMLAERLVPLEQMLEASGPFFLGARFSLADLTLAYWMPYVERWGGLEGSPAIRALLELTRARPALAPVFERQTDWTNRLLKARAR